MKTTINTLLLCFNLLLLNACATETSPERAIVEKISIKANINDVWNAWTTSAGIKTFFAPDANVEARPGGPFEIYMDPGAPAGMKGADGMVFLAIQDKKMISFTWNAPPSLPEVRKQHTVVVVRFTPRGDALTDVSLHHSGWGTGGGNGSDAEWDKAYDYFSKAWPNVLKNLKKRFDDGPIDWKPWLDRLQLQRNIPATSQAK
ncbi:MAG: SRPBCC domain-containing protein [Pseudomonadota bacterium]